MNPLGVRNCDICGEEIEIYHRKRLTSKRIFCSKECEGVGFSEPPNCECVICGKKMHRKPYRLSKVKDVTCSRECQSELNKIRMKGEGNHQYGLKGSLNASWKSDEKISSYGYRLIRCLDHPLRDCDDFVFEHRLVAEKYLLTDENSIEIDGIKYLSPDFVVHHIDMDRLNNSLDNLYVLMSSLHQRFHNKNRNLSSLSNEEKRIVFFNFLKEEGLLC